MGDTRRQRESLPIGYAKMAGRRSGGSWRIASTLSYRDPMDL